MKTPLSVHALYHNANIEGSRIYSELYSLLCRDTKDPFSDGLDIPVYYCTGDDNQIPDFTPASSDKNVYLVFIDINMYCSQAWRKRIADLMDQKDDHTIVIGVKQYQRAFSLNSKLGEIQSIVVDPDNTKENISLFADKNWHVFTTRLYDLLIRCLNGNAEKKPLNVFISHTKKGKGEKGEDYAKDVREFLASDTKLSTFFDVHDILDGYDFGNQIKEHAANSLLLVLFTNTYSSREWCRIEVLTAKEHKVPVITVSMLNGRVDRVFPYIGNVPSTVFNGDWRDVINLLLRTALDQANETCMLRQEENDQTEFFPFSPEALNLSHIKSTTTKILYPEPPLGNEELRVLNDICDRMGRNISFATPMSHFTEGTNLHEAKIGISVSESPNFSSLGIGKLMFDDLTLELTRHILKSNGRMIYGGDLRDNGFTQLFKGLSYQYGQKEKEDASVVYFDNYLSWPIFNQVTLPVKAEYIESRINLVSAPVGKYVKPDEVNVCVKPNNLENRLKWASSLTAMRKQMISKSSARIVVGGKIQGFTGYMAGIVEEFMLSVKKSHPIFLIGGFGGAAKILAEIIEGNNDSQILKDSAMQVPEYKEMYEWCEANNEHIDYESLDGLNIKCLNNHLSDEDNLRLLHSVDIIEIVSLVIKGLNATINNHEA